MAMIIAITRWKEMFIRSEKRERKGSVLN